MGVDSAKSLFAELRTHLSNAKMTGLFLVRFPCLPGIMRFPIPPVFGAAKAFFMGVCPACPVPNMAQGHWGANLGRKTEAVFLYQPFRDKQSPLRAMFKQRDSHHLLPLSLCTIRHIISSGQVLQRGFLGRHLEAARSRIAQFNSFASLHRTTSKARSCK